MVKAEGGLGATSGSTGGAGRGGTADGGVGSVGGCLPLNIVKTMPAAPSSKMTIAAIKRRPENGLNASIIPRGATVAVGVTVAVGGTTVGVCVGFGGWGVGDGVGVGV